MAPHVIVLGGGVAGMSAAHELVERGFRVTVYELKGMPGGKARSIPIHPARPGEPPALPGEHGFRFFPRFYRHVTDTMKRIPAADGRGSVFDHLTQTSRIGIFQTGKPAIVLSARFPRSLADLQLILKDLFHHPHLGLTEDDILFFGERMWQLITSCYERRAGEYEKIAWWDYIGAGGRSKAYQTWLATGISRSLVASKAEYANTKTDGDIMVQLLFDILEPGVSSDRVLDGPTSEVWLDPWLRYLRAKGVDYHEQAMVDEICFGAPDPAGRPLSVSGVMVVEQGQRRLATADYYIAALPVERMADLVLKFPERAMAAEPAFANILRLSKNVAWMNGIQFYLKDDAPLVHGHAIYIDSPWALTSISQQQFWPAFPMRQRGDGSVGGVISVDISDWGMWVNPRTREIVIGDFPENQSARGRFNGKFAFACTPDEIAEEVWAQLKASLNVDGQRLLPDAYVDYFLDPDIVITPVYQAIEEAGRLSLAGLMERLRARGVPEPGHPDQPISATTVEAQLAWLLSYGLIQAQAEGGETYYVASNPAIIAWALKQKRISAAGLRRRMGGSAEQAARALEQLAAHGLVRPPATPGGDHEPAVTINNDINLEPLLINLIDTWAIRPDAATRIPNLFLASDYVRTSTDLATMEGANEAARRAVNGIIGAAGVPAPSCKVWDLHEPWFFLPWRLYDLWRYKRGLPWTSKLPGLLELVKLPVLLARDLLALARRR